MNYSGRILLWELVGQSFNTKRPTNFDGVFCRIEDLDIATPGATALQIAIQAQVFTIINDEDYYYPDLLRGMIVTGDYGQDLVAYVGSTHHRLERTCQQQQQQQQQSLLSIFTHFLACGSTVSFDFRFEHG